MTSPDTAVLKYQQQFEVKQRNVCSKRSQIHLKVIQFPYINLCMLAYFSSLGGKKLFTCGWHRCPNEFSSAARSRRSPWSTPQARPPDPLLPAEASASEATLRGREKQLMDHLPVRGGSVKVRTKRREKSTKLPLRAFGNIYPPFIVAPLPRNSEHRRRGSAFFSGLQSQTLATV